MINDGGSVGGMFSLLRCDRGRNRGNVKFLIVILYRIAHLASHQRKQTKLSWIWAIPYLILYRFLTEFIFGIELPAATTIGRGLIIDHGYSLVVNKATRIGEFCRLRHSTTIGCKLLADNTQGPSPRIGHYVDIGANCVILGDVVIGDHVLIGAGAVVVSNIPSNSVAVGNPARVVRSLASAAAVA